MKIALAQTRPVKGDLLTNIGSHVYYVHQAADRGADIIFFPELSLTGYEPQLTHVLATNQDNAHFDIFQEEADRYNISICVGVPVKAEKGIWIGMVIFSPNAPRQTYGKKYIHPDEEAYFVPGPNLPPLHIKGVVVALAICYELSIDQHRKDALHAGAELYIASVAKVSKGTAAAHEILSEMAREQGIITAMVNCVGPAATGLTVGQSAVWNTSGDIVMTMDTEETGILYYDTESKECQIVQTGD